MKLLFFTFLAWFTLAQFDDLPTVEDCPGLCYAVCGSIPDATAQATCSSQCSSGCAVGITTILPQLITAYGAYASQLDTIVAQFTMSAGDMTQSAAGMTQSVAGMTQSADGMTQSAAGMTQSVAGMTQSADGMTESAAGMTESVADYNLFLADFLKSLTLVSDDITQSAAGMTESAAQFDTASTGGGSDGVDTDVFILTLVLFFVLVSFALYVVYTRSMKYSDQVISDLRAELVYVKAANSDLRRQNSIMTHASMESGDAQMIEIQDLKGGKRWDLRPVETAT